MGLGKGLCYGTHGPGFYKFFHVDFSTQNHTQDNGIVFREASPGPNDFGIKGHETTNGIFHLGHSKSDYNQFSGKAEQGQCYFLACLGTCNLEDLPTGVWEAIFLAESLELLGYCPCILVSGVDAEIGTEVKRPFQFFLVACDSHDGLRTQCLGGLSHVLTHAACNADNHHVISRL